MHTGTVSSGYDLRPPAALREPRPRYGQSVPPPGHGLAGHDLSALWDVGQFVLNARSYCREFMERMHHPFHEVLACLYLNAEQEAIAYNRYFRGDKISALSHLPDIAQTAGQLAATRVILAYNMSFDPEATLPDIRRVHARMAEQGVEVYEFLLISPGETHSLVTSVFP